MYNRELVSPCGLYCGLCGIRKAASENDVVMKEKLAKVYGLKPEDITCRGCRAEDNVFMYCRVCPIKSCADEKRFEGCYQCGQFPCDKIESFPFAEAKQNILRTVPRWRELGTEAWIKEEEALFTCKSCGTALFRGAKKCRNCNTIFNA